MYSSRSAIPGSKYGPGGESGGGGEGGGGGGGGGCFDEGPKHVTFLGKTLDEIPAAKDGIPGIGPVEQQEITEQGSPEQTEACKRDCDRQYEKDINQLDDNILMYEDRLKEGGISDQIIALYHEEIRTLRKQRVELAQPYNECIENCNPDPEEGDEDAVHGNGVVLSVYNISCEKIEADKQVVVSGEVNHKVCVNPRGEVVSNTPIAGTEDLFVMVEACGCCDE